MSLLLLFAGSDDGRRAIVGWAEFEVPTAPRRAIVGWAELEVPTAPRRAEIGWAEFEVPDAPRRAIITWSEFEVPTAPRRAEIGWAEFEVPDAPRRGIITWAEFEVPTAPRRGVIGWAELEVPTAPRRAIIGWAEFEVPVGQRRAIIGWAEFEVPPGQRRAIIGWAEFEVPEFHRRAFIGWAEFEVPERVDNPMNHTRVYVLSLRDEQTYKWGYWDFARLALSAGVVLEGAPTVGDLSGFATDLTAVDAGLSTTGRKVTISLTANALIGGESWQVWRKPDGGSWEIAGEVLAVGTSQSFTIVGPPSFDPDTGVPLERPWQALATYDVAVRIVKEGIVAPGFEGNPDAWTHENAPDAKTTCETLAETPVITAVLWERLSVDAQQITVQVQQPEHGVGFELEDATSELGSYSNISTYPVPTDDHNLVYMPPNDQLTTERWYRVRAARTGHYSDYSAPANRFHGPTTGGVPDFRIFQSTNTNDFKLWLIKRPADHVLEVQTSPAGAGTWTIEFFGPPGPGQSIDSSAPFDNTTLTDVRARYAVEVAGVFDYGDWSPTQSILLTNEAPPAAPVAFTGTVYNEETDIDAMFAAGGGSTGRLMRYLNGVESDSYVFAIENAAAVAHNFADLYHVPTYNNIEYFHHIPGGGNEPAPMTVYSYAIIQTGSRAKISPQTAEAVELTLDSAPGTPVLIYGAGHMGVSWANNVGSGRTQVYQSEDIDEVMAQGVDPVPVAGGSDSTTIPGLGKAALPTVGSVIAVRVWHEQLISGHYYRTAWAEDTVIT